MKLYQSELLNGIAGISHGFGTAGVALEEYVDGAIVPRTHQVHGNTVHVLDDEVSVNVLNGDAFITSKPDIVCFVRTADCVPILIADKGGKAVGAVHAGWRGTVKDVVGTTIRVMCDRFGVESKDMYAAIGPSICRNCYEVSGDVAEAFMKAEMPISHWARFGERRTYLDLKEANRDLLAGAGVEEENIEVLHTCTMCSDENLASYRKDKTDARQVSFILSRLR